MNRQKVALVTGAGRGIALAVAERFMETGYRVVLLDIDADALEDAARRFLQRDDILAVECDVASPSQVAAAVAKTVARFGRIDALVNNAGVAVFKPILETTHEEWERVLAVNLSGPFICAQACAPMMLKNGGGAIVNVASISGLRASTLRVAYGTSKAGLMHLTKQQAAELGTLGIRVNAVAPGPVDRHGEAGAYCRHSRRLPRCDPAEPLRNRAGNRGSGGVPLQRRGELHQRPDTRGRRRI